MAPAIVRVYFAAPLFTQAEWAWNNELSRSLRQHGCEVMLPQESALAMLSGEREFNAADLFQENVRCIDRAQVVVVILEGPDSDSGTCWECGYAYKSGIPIVGLRTDLRPGGDDPARPVNLMLAQSCAEFIHVPPVNRINVAEVASDIYRAILAAKERLDGRTIG